MEHIGYFFRRIFDRLSYQIGYKITDAADSKINETVETFSQRSKSDRQTTARQEQNIKY